MIDRCPECGATLKLLLTSWYCPNAEDHDEPTNPERTKFEGIVFNSPWIKIPRPVTVTIAPDIQTAVNWWGNPTHSGSPGKCPHAKQYRDDDSNIWCYDCGTDPN